MVKLGWLSNELGCSRDVVDLWLTLVFVDSSPIPQKPGFFKKPGFYVPQSLEKGSKSQPDNPAGVQIRKGTTA